MSSNKDNYSLQELLLLIEETDSEKGPDLPSVTPDDPLSPLDSFINEFNLCHGIDRVPTHVVYYTYSEVFKGTLSKIMFFKSFKKLFSQKRTGRQRVYMLDSRSFDMSREGLLKAEFHNKAIKS